MKTNYPPRVFSVLVFVVVFGFVLHGCGQISNKKQKTSSGKKDDISTKDNTAQKGISKKPDGNKDNTGKTKSADSKITIRPIDEEGLEKEIASHKGKVVVLDLWANWCAPCKKEFPHLVELHEKYGDQGLVCMSLCLPADNEKDLVKNALEFLRAKKANFSNFYWNDETYWADAFSIDLGPPVVIVYGPDGKQPEFEWKFKNENGNTITKKARRFDDTMQDFPYTYEDVEKLVVKLLPK